MRKQEETCSERSRTIRIGIEAILKECVDDFYRKSHSIQEIRQRIQRFESSQGVVIKSDFWGGGKERVWTCVEPLIETGG